MNDETVMSEYIVTIEGGRLHEDGPYYRKERYYADDMEHAIEQAEDAFMAASGIGFLS